MPGYDTVSAGWKRVTKFFIAFTSRSNLGNEQVKKTHNGRWVRTSCIKYEKKVLTSNMPTTSF